MKKHIADFRIALLVALIGFGAGAPVGAQQNNNSLDIANVPVFLGSQPKPNVMLSVRTFAETENSVETFAPYLFPQFIPQQIKPPNPKLSFDPTKPLVLQSRSTLNTLFYDPSREYRPWVRPDGTRFPQADPDAARFDPVYASGDNTIDLGPPVETFDLDSLNSGTAWLDSALDFFNTSGLGIDEQRQYWPITFLTYEGGDVDSPSSYTLYQIQENQAFRAQPADATPMPISGFSWPGGITRTVEEEKQNFANWFQYHRSTVEQLKFAVGEAFFEAGTGFRAGYAITDAKEYFNSFNFSADVDGVDNKHVVNGVRDLGVPANRQAFFDRLYGAIQDSSISNQFVDSMMSVGEYFSREDDRGPWSSTPGQAGGTFSASACRKSFNVAVGRPFQGTPGSGLDAPFYPGNADGSPGPLIVGPGNQQFQYQPIAPFADNEADTTADAAMYYWKRDLLPNVANRVAPSPENPAFWQNLSTFFVAAGGQNSITIDEAYAAAENNTPINWPSKESISNPGASDTAVHTVLNGRGGYFEGESLSELVGPLSEALREIAARAASVGGVSVSATRLTQNTVAYGAEFDSSDWTGELRAINLTTQSTEWEASVDLNARAPGSRTILTYDGNGTGFDTGMSSSLKALIDGDPARADDIIRYVRGEPVAGFRPRTSILGDIVNSKPTLAGPSNEGWASLPAPAGGSTYATFVDDKAQVDDVVYVGGNGGMLHAFDAETGEEVFGYVPRAVLPKLGALTDDPYAHQFYVDGQQTVRDAWDGSQWRRVLVGTLGAGGRGVYALDITDPSAPAVLWEITGDDTPLNGDPDLGFVFGEPLITRLGESGPGGGTGNWKAIFGNGYNSTNGDSILYSVDLFTGSATKITVDSGGGGLSAPELVLEPTSRRFTSRVYAGDLDGTVWRVDFDDSGTPSVKYPNGLFTTANNRPITSAPGLAASPSGGLLVYVGTGKLLETNDRLSTDFESFYAVRDQGSALGANPALGSVSVSNAGNNVEFVGNPGADGWVLDLTDAGERVVEPPRILFGQLIFSSFEPVDDPCDKLGAQRLYVLDATTGSGELDDICANCGVIDFGSGGPIAPPLVITPPPSPGSGPPPNDPTDPFADPGGNLPGGSAVGALTGWCATLGATDGATTTQLGQICDGRQVWRQVR